MIRFEHLTKRYGERLALDAVSFEAREGEILGVLGPNGAGKTTALRILCGYLPPTAGVVRVGELDVARRSLEIRRRIGYLPENNPLYPEMRVDEYLRFRAGVKSVPRRTLRARVGQVVERCDLQPVARRIIGQLSKGYRQRVGLADALVADPPILVLDEPTVGLDPNQAVRVRELIRGLGGRHTVLLSSHLLHDVDLVCDRLVIFRGGRVIAADTSDNLRRRLSAGASVTLELAADDWPSLEPVVEGLGVATVEPLADGWVRVTVDAEEDPREALFRAAAARDVVLRELTRRQVSLEEIFHQLTADEPAVAEEAP